MAKFIKTVVDRCNFASKKGLSGYFSPERICAELHAESMNTWRSYIKEFEKTQVMDTYTRPFQFKEEVTLTDGVGTIVSKDYLYYFEGYVSATETTEIKIVDDRKFLYRKNHPVKTPTIKYPVGNTFNQVLTVLPITAFPKAIISFLKKPTLPVYAYTLTGDRYLYDDANSVDWEWHDSLGDLIVDKALANLGISIRNLEMQQFSKEQRILDNQPAQ